MPLPTFSLSEFTGTLNVSQTQYNDIDFAGYCEVYTKKFLKQILSDSAYLDIKNNNKSKWNDFLTGVEYVDVCNENKENEGFNTFLRHIIYFYWIRDYFKSTPSGTVVLEVENAKPIPPPHAVVMSRYNEGVNILLGSVYPFVKNYSEVSGTVTSSIEVAGDYTLTVPSTVYLSDGDAVIIENNTYTAANVTVGTFDILGIDTGLDFTGNTYLYKPFDISKLNLPILQYAFE